jgi:hypothetical protein
MKKAFLLLLTISILAGCGNTLSKETCIEKAKTVNTLINQFWETSDTSNIRLALAITDSVYPICPYNKDNFAIKKIGLLSILEDYQRAYLLIDSLENSLFQLEFERSMYYHNLKARHYGKLGQFVKKDAEAKIAVAIVEKYLNENPDSWEAIMDLAASMAIYADEETYYATLNERIKHVVFEEDWIKEAVQNSIIDTYKLFNP